MRQLRIVVGLGVSVLFLALLLAKVDRGELVEAFRDLSPAWIVLALELFGASVWTRAQRWAAILRPIVPLRSTEAASLMTIGLAANNVLPARTGEIVRAVLLKRRYGVSGFAVVATIVVERILDGLVLAIFLAATIALAGGTDVLRVFAALVGGAFLVLAGGTALVAMRPAAGDALVGTGLRLLPARIRPRARGWADRFRSGLAPMRTGRSWVVVGGLTTLSWGLEVLSCWAVGQAFGLDLPLGIYFGVAGAANLSMAAPSTSGGIGPYEYFAREVVMRFGVGAATGTAFALVLHATVLVPVALAGLVLVWRQDLGLRTLAAADAAEIADGEPAGAPLDSHVDAGTEAQA
ncbi:MAG: lysylphosphatidylglycerol synthase transmembrane domain-containing protein [Dehalococcoidia bacterium]